MKVFRLAPTLLFSVFSLFAPLVQAEEPRREGTKIEISPAEVEGLKQWIENAKHDLEQALEKIGTELAPARVRILRQAFEEIVEESGTRENELYVRWILNRTLEIDEVIGDKPTLQEIESLAGLYQQAAEMAIKYYVNDIAFLNAIGSGTKPAAELAHVVAVGLEYADIAMRFAKTLLNPQKEYVVTRSALGFLGNDLNSPRNLRRAVYADEILRIQQALTRFPAAPAKDVQTAIQDVRKLKFEYRVNIRPKVAARG